MQHATLDITKGQITGLHLHGVIEMTVQDCRGGHIGFVGICATDADGGSVDLYTSQAAARRLHHQLGKLFVGDDVAGLFQELFHKTLTTDSLRELKEAIYIIEDKRAKLQRRLDEIRQATFPPEVDPGDAVAEAVKDTLY